MDASRTASLAFPTGSLAFASTKSSSKLPFGLDLILDGLERTAYR
jgi:hypothetical protein